ncbi:hypothetical protein OG21DRAFT_590866 [Imleria badia]|nr:hypothetical protein OG21DRAFT_590866 [Imleria badia]
MLFLMTDGDDLDLQPPAKRKRRSFSSDAMESVNKQFWFEDGDIVLGIEDKHVKIHQSKLMGSLVFSTMLALPQPELMESFDGCPFVKLPHDTFHDWIPVLEWMYDRSSFELRSTSLDITARALRIATKYEILEVRQWCKQQLLSRWPLKVVEMNTTAMANAAEAICLARELDIPEILPAAFYALAVQRWSNGGDGGRSHLILSPDDLRRLIVGREMLHERLTALLFNWDPHINAEFFSLCRVCDQACMLSLPEQLMPALHSPYGNWLLHDLDRMSKNGFEGLYACERCVPTLRYAVNQFLAQLQDAIPSYFML